MSEDRQEQTPEDDIDHAEQFKFIMADMPQDVFERFCNLVGFNIIQTLLEGVTSDHVKQSDKEMSAFHEDAIENELTIADTKKLFTEKIMKAIVIEETQVPLVKLSFSVIQLMMQQGQKAMESENKIITPGGPASVN